MQTKCNNAAHPDSFGNYREAKVVQIKHHWFWKLGYTFEQLNETRSLKNLHVLLLEEDHYLMPDSIHVLRKLSEKYELMFGNIFQHKQKIFNFGKIRDFLNFVKKYIKKLIFSLRFIKFKTYENFEKCILFKNFIILSKKTLKFDISII